MDAFRPREIVSLNYLWRDGQGQPWLVTYDLAELDGRAECVGMSVRSYLALPVPEADEKLGAYKVWVQTPVTADDLANEDWPTVDGSPQSLNGALIEHELGALNVHADQEFSLPRMLRAVTLRELPFADVLERARRQSVASLRGFQEAVLSRGDMDADTRSAVQARFDAEVEALTPPRTPSGRHKSYPRPYLELVAATYRKAFDGGSRSPTLDTALALDISRSTAAKLVMRCRDPRVGLLSPTSKTKAGGTRPPQTD